MSYEELQEKSIASLTDGHFAIEKEKKGYHFYYTSGTTDYSVISVEDIYIQDKTLVVELDVKDAISDNQVKNELFLEIDTSQEPDKILVEADGHGVDYRTYKYKAPWSF